MNSLYINWKKKDNLLISIDSKHPLFSGFLILFHFNSIEMYAIFKHCVGIHLN